jgi:hypothetical protein
VNTVKRPPRSVICKFSSSFPARYSKLAPDNARSLITSGSSLFDKSFEDKVDTLVQQLSGKHENNGEVSCGEHDSDITASDGQGR